MLNKTSGTLSASGDISSAIANAITAMPIQTNRNKNLLPAFADILATSSETAAWTGSDRMPETQVAAKPQSASGPGNRTASIAHGSAEIATQVPGTEQLVPAYALGMSDWATANREDTMNSTAPSETNLTAPSAPSPSLVGGEVSGPQTSNRPVTILTNVTAATSTALSSSFPMSRCGASSAGFPENGFVENTLPVAETSNYQPVTSAEFEPSPVEVFVSPSTSRSSSRSSAPTVASHFDLSLKAFAGSPQAAASDSNRSQSTSTNIATLPLSDLGGPRPPQESSFGSTAATLTANPTEISGPTISETPTATLSSTQASQNTVEAPAPKRIAQQAMPAYVSAGGAETDMLAEALGALLRRFSASSVTSTVISNVPSVVTTTSIPSTALTDLATSYPVSTSEPTNEAAPSARPLAGENLEPTNSVDTPAFNASTVFLSPPDFPTVTISCEQNSETIRPATGMAEASSTLPVPDPGPTDTFAQAPSVMPILTPIASQPIAHDPTTTTTSLSMTPAVRTLAAPSTLLEASSVLEAMVTQTIDAVLTQARAKAPHVPTDPAEQIVASASGPAIPMAAAPYAAATPASSSTPPQQQRPSQSFAPNPKIETPAPASVTLLPQPSALSVASSKIPFVLTPAAANPVNLAVDNSAPSSERAITASMSPGQPALSNEKPVWGISTNVTASGTPASADAPAPAAPAAFNQDSESQTDTSSHSPNYGKTSSTESTAIATPAPTSAGAAVLAQVVSITDATPKPDASDVAAGGTAPNRDASSDAQLPSSVLAQRASEGLELSAALQFWNGGDNAQTRLVQAAHLGGNLRESEMNISMQAESLGVVELRARVSGDVVGAAIGVERHDAHVMISNNLSSLHDALQERQLRLGNVTVFQSPVHSGATAGDGSAPQQRGTAPRQPASTGWAAPQAGLSPTEAAAAAESSEGNAVFDSNGRLSVRA